MTELRLDEVGPWTRLKLQILREYAGAYARILSNQSVIRHYAYIDGFAGWGTHVDRETGEEIEGSPAILLKQQFSHYHFIDTDGKRAQRLRQLAAGRSDVTVYEGDCNDVLLNKVFPQCRYADYRRALCLLDPYQLNPDWRVVEAAGSMKSIEILLNFMIMDANMNVLHKDPYAADPTQVERMNAFWGDETWRGVAYKSTALFEDIHEKLPNIAVVDAYRRRLRDVAGFRFVPDALPMMTRRGAVIYYLIFASNNETGAKIARAVFDKFRK